MGCPSCFIAAAMADNNGIDAFAALPTRTVAGMMVGVRAGPGLCKYRPDAELIESRGNLRCASYALHLVWR